LDLTGLKTWNWSDFNGTNLAIQIDTPKGTGSVPGGSPGTVGFDQAGFLIETDGEAAVNCRRTIDPLPLSDFYDPTRLEFVSASIEPDAFSSAGPTPNTEEIYWANLGPLFPGGSVSVEVTFRVLEPPSNTATATDNLASITEATFFCGRPTNEVEAVATTNVLPAGTLGGRLWRDLNSNGVQDGGAETGIAFATVQLTPPTGVDLGAGPGNPITTQTDADGFYLFTGLPATGSYTVTVLTATFPGAPGPTSLTNTALTERTSPASPSFTIRPPGPIRY
jgi:hypothetical protein